jgi:hypothetical protein
MDQTAQVMRLQDENHTLRQALRDIAQAEPIPNTSGAFLWCKRVASEALNSTPST